MGKGVGGAHPHPQSDKQKNREFINEFAVFIEIQVVEVRRVELLTS